MIYNMKSLLTFINESLNEGELLSTIKRMMSNDVYDKLKEWSGEDDPKRFDIQKENEKTIIGDADNVIGTAEYYNHETGKDFDKLGLKEKADYDAKNGDIIILDKDGKASCFIDVKIADKYLGAVSLGSLSKFRDDGYYLLICKKGKFFKVVSHKDIVKAVNDDILKLNPPVNDYKGYDVDWNGEKLTSEYFIKGNDIRRNL